MQCQRVERSTHFAFQRFVNQLVLLHTGLTTKRLRYNRGRLRITVTGKVTDGYICVRQLLFDQLRNFIFVHGH